MCIQSCNTLPLHYCSYICKTIIKSYMQLSYWHKLYILISVKICIIRCSDSLYEQDPLHLQNLMLCKQLINVVYCVLAVHPLSSQILGCTSSKQPVPQATIYTYMHKLVCLGKAHMCPHTGWKPTEWPINFMVLECKFCRTSMTNI